MAVLVDRRAWPCSRHHARLSLFISVSLPPVHVRHSQQAQTDIPTLSFQPDDEDKQMETKVLDAWLLCARCLGRARTKGVAEDA